MVFIMSELSPICPAFEQAATIQRIALTAFSPSREDIDPNALAVAIQQAEVTPATNYKVGFSCVFGDEEPGPAILCTFDCSTCNSKVGLLVDADTQPEYVGLFEFGEACRLPSSNKITYVALSLKKKKMQALIILYSSSKL
jgi:hypothetical protein